MPYPAASSADLVPKLAGGGVLLLSRTRGSEMGELSAGGERGGEVMRTTFFGLLRGWVGTMTQLNQHMSLVDSVNPMYHYWGSSRALQGEPQAPVAFELLLAELQNAGMGCQTYFSRPASRHNS